MLLLLVKGSKTPGPMSEQLARWQSAFLTRFDRHAGDIFDDPKDARRRRREIERTFSPLAKLALVDED